MSDLLEPYRPAADAPWNLARVVHLHRRAGFAATWGEIQRDLGDGPEASVSRLLDGKARADGQRPQFEDLSRQIADAAVTSDDPERLKAWWILRMLFSSDPLAERLALMWHNHFATSNLKVRNLSAMRRQNETFRRLARAPFGELLTEMLRDPALLVWLDAPSNRKDRPNENLARELMELFTLGVGNFTEDDVKQAARALTGLGTTDGNFRPRPDWHDEGEKTILGVRSAFDVDSLRELLLSQPPTARRLARRIIATFVGDEAVTEADIDALAKGLRDHNLGTGWAVETVLRSALFFSDANLGARVVGPTEFIIGAARALELFDPPPSTLVLAEWARRLGLDLFNPPNVGGWREGRDWLTTRTLLARANYAAALVAGELSLSGAVPDLAKLARRTGRGASNIESLRFFHELLLGACLPDKELHDIEAAAGGSLARAVALLLAAPAAQIA